jgi:hypothetical protein
MFDPAPNPLQGRGSFIGILHEFMAKVDPYPWGRVGEGTF